MGFMVDGVWRQEDAFPTDGSGRFTRVASPLRNWVTPDGAAGPSGIGGFAAEPGRYHLYVSLACPWAHRTLIFRVLKGLQEMIGLSVVHWYMGADGWTFVDVAGVIPDPIQHATLLHQVYTAGDPHFTGRITVPVLWDRKTAQIVNNESSEIIRMMNSAFDGVGAAPGDFYPEDLREEIDAINARVYDTVNNGVYKSGFARSQKAYDEAVATLFESLDWLEDMLSSRRWLTGDRLTEADWRLFTTLVRFDAVYVGHFKCNIRRIADYPHLTRYLKDLYRQPGIAETVNIHHIKHHYYESHPQLNPSRIVPVGPKLDFLARCS
ncbi:glutathione S-transferase family protein [Rhodopseudomonas sp. P2A-2r]|uniref:glutathione S-transferase family protein n=1 Tax=Rhodopseudomonas sp. P2A-2r TaxID=2991972 RepID=UPI002233EF71|nr:glutathione S-transferase family protein [Rhodopseudomonas sp. P2A-2r]UZE49570.1 glutathione S-transferase family protein [Rhodopseudomonas sp. P2A-2r]